MTYCNCCPGGCLLVAVAEALVDAMQEQTSSYYQGDYELHPVLPALTKLHSYTRMLLCEQTRTMEADQTLGLWRSLEGVPTDLRDKFLVAIQRQQRNQKFVSGSPVVLKERPRRLRLLGS